MTTIDGNHSTSDEGARCVRRQHQRHCIQIPHLPNTLLRDAAGGKLAPLLCFEPLRVHLSDKVARGKSIDSDVAAGQLQCEHLGHLHHCCFGHTIGALTPCLPQAQNRRHVDDAPSYARLHHPSRRFASDKVGTSLIDCHEILVVLEACVNNLLWHSHASAIDNDITHSTSALFRLCKTTRYAGRICNIHLNHKSAPIVSSSISTASS
mmetsp:Transcript_8108/g.18059  ORF Transcript_8108/g.18059 Transcript_8108/m.18059 type:complete len:208 (-) Transcript_8108:239-862(-)